jgi:hypothetical protein
LVLNQRRSRKAATVLSILALPAAIVLWASGIALSSLQLTGLGLVAGLHTLWYVGVMTAVAGMLCGIATRRHSVLLTAYALAIVLMLSSTGVLLERTPRFPYIFTSYSYGDQILHTSAIDYSQVYVSWPAWHVVTAILVGASRADPTMLLSWLPLWLLLVTLAALMTLFRRFRLPRHQRWIAIALAAVAFLGPVYPLPTSFALILLTYAVAMLLDVRIGRADSLTGRVGFILLLTALVPTHLLTSLVAILVIGATSFLIAFVLRRPAGPAVILGSVLLAGYLFYIATQVTAELLPAQLQIMLSLDRLFGSISSSTASAIGSGSDAHVQVVRVRIGYVVAVAALAALGVLVAIVRKRPLRGWILPTAWTFGGLGSLGVGGYVGEILARASTLAGPGSLALASSLARVGAGRISLAATMMVAIIFSPIFLFGNELFDYVRPTELAADAFLEARHPPVWTLARPSRTWYREVEQSAGAPSVIVYGPLYDLTSAHIGIPDPPIMAFWSYDNGDVRIMVVQ